MTDRDHFIRGPISMPTQAFTIRCLSCLVFSRQHALLNSLLRDSILNFVFSTSASSFLVTLWTRDARGPPERTAAHSDPYWAFAQQGWMHRSLRTGAPPSFEVSCSWWSGARASECSSYWMATGPKASCRGRCQRTKCQPSHRIPATWKFQARRMPPCLSSSSFSWSRGYLCSGQTRHWSPL